MPLIAQIPAAAPENALATVDRSSPPDKPRRLGGQLYFAASLFGQVAALVRYITLARLLGPEQLGLAATLVVTASFFDLISDTGSDRFLIQDRHGDTETVQRLVQLVYVARGALIAISLIVFAIPIAAFYKQPQLAVGFAVLALSPFIIGFTHLDLRRAQRRQDFRPEAMSIIAGEAAGLIATAAAAWVTRDFKAILWGLITRAAVMVLVSHMTAQRRYGLAWSREHGRRLSHFSGPLMLSGLMLFVGSQGDRVIVVNQLGAKLLGEYSATLLLIYYPAAVILKYMHVIYMPMIADSRDDAHQRNQVGDLLGGQTLLLAIAMAVGFAIVAPWMVTILFGGRFTQAALLVGLIGILQTTRFMINWPTTVALSMGRSRTVLYSNLARLFVFPGAFIGLRLVGGLIGVVLGFAAGEIISIAIALALVNLDTDRPFLAGFDRFSMFIATAALITAWNLAIGKASITVYVVLGLFSVGLAALLTFRERRVVSESLSEARRVVGFVRHARNNGLPASRRSRLGS